jgi:N-methylhydantoinase A
MARALRAVSTERGRDPRDLVVLAFGGNGPVHAATLARLLDIRKILVPPVPGLFSALGMLFPEIEHHYVRTFKQRLDSLDVDALEVSFSALQAEGTAALISEGYGTPLHRFERLIDLRYAGANSELTLPCPTDRDLATTLKRSFGEAHERQYGYRSDAETVETMNLRVIARAATTTSRFPIVWCSIMVVQATPATAPRTSDPNSARLKHPYAPAARSAPNGEMVRC